MFASVNVFTVKAGEMENFLALNADHFLPLLQQQGGIVGFDIARTGERDGVAIIWWDSEEARLIATPVLAEWVARHLEPYVETLNNPAGPVILSWRRS